MSTSLPPLNVHITTDAAGPSSFHSNTAPPPSASSNPLFKTSYIYLTPPPALSLSGDADLTHYLDVTSVPPLPSFPAAGGTVYTVLDFLPNPEGKGGKMHRTQTLDYIFMMEGELEYSLDSGEKRICRKGDLVVQRAAMHSWRNMSATEGARMGAVMLGIEGAVAGAIEFLD